VRHRDNDTTWTDHTDTRPTMLALVGLQDTYEHDGRVLIDQLDAWAVPNTLRAHRETLRRLGEVYKQLNAPFGQFGADALVISTQAIKSGGASDAPVLHGSTRRARGADEGDTVGDDVRWAEARRTTGQVADQRGGEPLGSGTPRRPALTRHGGERPAPQPTKSMIAGITVLGASSISQ